MALRVPRQRPIGPVRAAGAFGRDLAAFYYLPLGSANGAAFWDAVTGLQGDDESGQTLAHTPNGRGLKYNGSTRATYTNFANPKGVTSDGTTIIARVKLTTKPGSTYSFPASIQNSGSGRGGASIAFNTSGNAMGGQQTSAGFIAGTDSTDWTDKWVTLGGSGISQGNPDGQLFVNGIFIATTGGGTVASSQAPSAVYIGRDISGYWSGFTGEIEYVAAFTRILSRAEQLAFYRDPYGMALGAEPINFSWAAVSGNTYNEDVTEGATAADAPSAQANFNSAANDNPSAADAPTAQANFNSTVSESGAALDAPAAQASFNSATAESATALDAENAVRTLSETTTESGAAAETESAQANFNSAVPEAGTALETPTAQAIFQAVDNESATSLDTESVIGATYPGSLDELASAVDTVSARMDFNSAVAESAPAAETPSAQGVFNAADAESSTALDLPSGGAATYPGDLSELATAVDTVTARMDFSSSVSETASPSDTESAQGSFQGSVAESGGAIETPSAQGAFNSSVVEAGSALDGPSAAAIYAASVQESAAALEAASSVPAQLADVTQRYIAFAYQDCSYIARAVDDNSYVTHADRDYSYITSVKG